MIDPGEIIDLGECSDRVAELQRRLEHLGIYKGSVDGWYGEYTQTAVTEFRQAYSLTVDGGAEVETWERLDAEARSSGYEDQYLDQQTSEAEQLSEDGQWRWDGAEWQPVNGTIDTATEAAESSDARPAWGTDGDEEQLSVLDGRYEWRVVNHEPRDGSPGGWKEAESFVGFRTFSTIPRNIRIGFRVGVPIVSHEGFISDEFATSSAIAASQVAGRGLLMWLRANDPLGIAPESMIEATFIRLMGEAMEERIKGSRVTRVTIPTRR